jgi:cytochrome c
MLAAAEAGLVWTDETLDVYLANPRDFVKGTRMSFAGLRKPEDRAAMIAYLSSFAE